MNPADKAHVDDLVDVLKGAFGALSGFIIRFGARISFLFMAGNIFGAERLGAYAYSIAIIETLAAIAIFGQKRSLFALLENDAPEGSPRESGLAAAAISWSLLLSMVFALALSLGAWPLLGMAEPIPEARLFAFVIPLIAVSEVFLSLTRHRRKVRYDVLARSIVEPWTLAGLTLLAWLAGYLEWGLLAAYFGALVASFFLSLWGVGKLYDIPAIIRARPQLSYLKELTSFSTPTAAVDVIALAFRRVDIFLLGILSTEVIVGIYYAAQNIATLVQKTRHVFDPILAPVISQTMSRRGHGHAARQLEQVCRWIFTILAIQVLLLGYYAGPLLELIGPGMAAGALALILMMMAEALDGTIASVELPLVFRHPRYNLGLSTLSFLVHLAGCYLLIPQYGAAGAAGSLLLSLTVLNVLRIWLAHKVLNMWALSWQYIKPALAVFVSFAALKLLGTQINLHSALGWPLGISAGIGTYILTLKILGISAEGRALIERLRGSKENTT